MRTAFISKGKGKEEKDKGDPAEAGAVMTMISVHPTKNCNGAVQGAAVRQTEKDRFQC